MMDCKFEIDPFITAQLTVRNIVHMAMDHCIEDVEYVELEPDPAAGPAPVASLLYNPNK